MSAARRCERFQYELGREACDRLRESPDGSYQHGGARGERLDRDKAESLERDGGDNGEVSGTVGKRARMALAFAKARNKK